MKEKRRVSRKYHRDSVPDFSLTYGTKPEYYRQEEKIRLQQQLAFSDGENDQSRVISSPVLVVDPQNPKRQHVPPPPQRPQYPRAPPATSQTSVVGYHGGVTQSARLYSPEIMQLNNVSLREQGRSKPSYDELKNKFSKQRSKTKEMKSVLNDYAQKMREMQDQMEAQEH